MTAVANRLLTGIRAAMVLSGLVILLGIAASTPAFFNFFHDKEWTYTGIRETFLATILLGLLLGWFFPVKVKKYCTPLVVAPSIVLFLLANFFLVVGEHKPVPHETKLADCSGNLMNIHLTAPEGHRYSLVLEGLPPGRMTNGTNVSSYRFTGKMRVTTNRSKTTDVPLDSDKMFVFSDALNLGPIDLKGGKDYEIQIEFNPPPPPSSFVSLYWMQSYADRK